MPAQVQHTNGKCLRRLAANLLFLVAVVCASYVLAFFIRFDGAVPDSFWPVILLTLPVLTVVKVAIFWRMRLTSGWWKYVSLPDLLIIAQANVLSTLVFLLVYVFFVHHLVIIPRSIFILDGLLCFMLISGIRVLARIFSETVCQCLKESRAGGGKVLVVGAGAAGQSIVREIMQNPNLNMSVAGFLDTDDERHGQRFQGVPVLGTPDDLVKVCCEQCIDMVIVAQSAVCHRELRSIVESCRKAKVKSKILPTVGEIIKEEVSIRHVRDVELEDLLGRRPVRLDVEDIRSYLNGKKVLVTGAGGSIGSEICRQVVNFSPSCLVLLDNAESPLFNIERELALRAPGIRLIPSLSDIRDEQKIRKIFNQYQPDVVFHAAAYKHVPMLELHPYEALSNNVIGTRVLADAAHAAGVSRFVMISTDKAVNPANVMGASKRAAEIYVQHLARSSATNFITVRFGNVLGSNGSVIPIFKEQIEKGGPVTVTHPEVTRFFMTIPEAAQLVMQAGSMGKGGEIFLLDMGEPVRILYLAEELIRLSGLRPYEDIDIEFNGLRPGEKLYEELLLSGEDVLGTTHDKIFVAGSVDIDDAALKKWLAEISQVCRDMSAAELVEKLREIVPEFSPSANAGQARQRAGTSFGGKTSSASLPVYLAEN